MKQTPLVFLVTMIFHMELASAQVNKIASNYEPLKVGDEVPDYELINLVNYPTRTTNLSNFRGKLLILDFWSSGCVSCIESWPKLEDLQQKFKGKIQILLINPWQNETEVKRMMEKRRRAGVVDLTLPSVCRDTLILKLFPAKSVPHIVWIDETGIIKSITNSDVLNSNNIEAMLKKQELKMDQKIDPEIAVDYMKPLFVGGNGGDGDRLLWHSVLSKYCEGLYATHSVCADPQLGYAIYISNLSVLDLYRFAYSNKYSLINNNELIRLPLNRVLLDMKDASNYVGQINGEFQKKNCFVYQLNSPPTTKSKLQSMMQADLKRFFGLEVEWEIRKTKCLVLSMEDASLIAYKSGEYNFSVTDSEININNVSIDFIIERIEQIYDQSQYPIMNEVDYNGKMGGISLITNTRDHRSLDRALKKYGMRFKLEDRKISMLVIKESILSSPGG